jgi:hypothetical protein
VPVDDFSNYQSFLARRIADGVRRAVNNLEPAKIAFGAVDEPSQIFNRRWHVTDPSLLGNPFGGVDQVRMNPPAGNAALVRPAGPIDPQIAFLSVQSVDGRPISLLANYSLHYVGGVKGAEVSADYFGCFANKIAELLNAEKQSPPFVGILSNGTSGDCNNVNFQTPSPRKEPYQKMQEVADLVAQRVYETHQSLEFQSEVSLAAATADLTLAVRKPTPEMLARFDELEKEGWPKEKCLRHETDLRGSGSQSGEVARHDLSSAANSPHRRHRHRGRAVRDLRRDRPGDQRQGAAQAHLHHRTRQRQLRLPADAPPARTGWIRDMAGDEQCGDRSFGQDRGDVVEAV